MRLTRGRLLRLLRLAWLVLSLPGVGLTRLTLPAVPLTIPAGLTLPVLPLIPAAFPSFRSTVPSTVISAMIFPAPVLPLSPLTIPAVGIARRMVLTIPTVGLTPRLLPLPLLTLEAIGITPGLLKLSLLPPEPIGIALGRLKLRPLPLEHVGIAPWRLRGEGPGIRLTRDTLIRSS